jgi:hypothetical protein
VVQGKRIDREEGGGRGWESVPTGDETENENENENENETGAVIVT